jgi:hypothetical protein
MTVYSGAVFDMAVNQFEVIASHLSIPMHERDRLLMSKRAVTSGAPLRIRRPSVNHTRFIRLNKFSVRL